MRVFEYQITTDQSMGGDYTSSPVYLNQIAMGSIEAVWTGSPVGEIKLQVSVNHKEAANGGVAVAGTWTDYTNSEYSMTTAGSVVWNLSNIGYQYIRVVYTRTSGTGTLNVFGMGKGV
jgi:hypothetical protein